MDNQEKYDSPKKNFGDIVHTGIRAVLSSVPFVGAPAIELFAFLVAPPLEKRRDEWIRSIAEGLVALENERPGFQIDALAEDETFLATLINASRAAIAASRDETRQALRNAVLNSPLPTAPDDIRQKIFIHWIDEFSAWHIKILEMFDDPGVPEINLDDPAWWRTDITLEYLADFIEEKFPEMRGHYSLYIQIVMDLHTRGLIANAFPERALATRLDSSPKLTPVGKEFLEFIRSPLKENR